LAETLEDAYQAFWDEYILFPAQERTYAVTCAGGGTVTLGVDSMSTETGDHHVVADFKACHFKDDAMDMVISGTLVVLELKDSDVYVSNELTITGTNAGAEVSADKCVVDYSKAYENFSSLKRVGTLCGQDLPDNAAADSLPTNIARFDELLAATKSASGFCGFMNGNCGTPLTFVIG
jgi:hypothetical protein